MARYFSTKETQIPKVPKMASKHPKWQNAISSLVILPSEYNKNIWIQFTFNHTNTDTNTDTYGQTQTQTQTQTQPHKHKHRHIWSYGIYW